jgi:ferredoxin
VGPHDTLLEALERAGADMMFDCRKGECGLCAVDIVGLNGHVDHRDVFFSESQKTESRKICSCVSRVVGGQSNPDYAGTIVLDIP